MSKLLTCARFTYWNVLLVLVGLRAWGRTLYVWGTVKWTADEQSDELVLEEGPLYFGILSKFWELVCGYIHIYRDIDSAVSGWVVREKRCVTTQIMAAEETSYTIGYDDNHLLVGRFWFLGESGLRFPRNKIWRFVECTTPYNTPSERKREISALIASEQGLCWKKVSTRKIYSQASALTYNFKCKITNYMVIFPISQCQGGGWKRQAKNPRL